MDLSSLWFLDFKHTYDFMSLHSAYAGECFRTPSSMQNYSPRSCQNALMHPEEQKVPVCTVSDAAAGRELLRTGALDGLRDNIRSVLPCLANASSCIPDLI